MELVSPAVAWGGLKPAVSTMALSPSTESEKVRNRYMSPPPSPPSRQKIKEELADSSRPRGEVNPKFANGIVSR